MKKWIKKYMKPSEVEHISKLVSELELKTQAEIVPMIVGKSSAVGHVPLAVFLICFSFGLLLETYFGYRYLYADIFVIGLALVSTGLSIWLSKFKSVQNFFVPKQDQWQQVRARAEIEFHRQGLDKTHDHIAVLLFVSVMERKAFVLADKGVSEKLDAKFWQDSLNLLLQEIKKDHWSAGFEKSLKQIGAVLAEHFPAKHHDVNELPNSLIIQD